MDEDTLNKGTSTLRSECSEALQESLISNALRDLGISKDEIPLLNEAFDLYEKNYAARPCFSCARIHMS